MKIRDFISRLAEFDVTAKPRKRGKGSETILSSDTRLKDGHPLFHTIKNHGKGTEVYRQVVQAVCRKFGIDEDEFYRL